jgi:GDPmannose 4,6-dehydratase
MNKVAFITGITGQDGAYLCELLLNKGYEVHGLIRRTSVPNTDRIAPYINDINLHYGDLTDGLSLINLLNTIQPDEVYNLAAMSDVAISFDTPEYTANTDALGTLRLLEGIRILGLKDKTRFYQASTSELYGNAKTNMQNEETPFHPCSPYACAKLYAYWTVVNYRNAYGIHASNGILFNHESPLRGEGFVTQKICNGVRDIYNGHQSYISLGNLNAERDWGHARDYVRGMHMMMKASQADDYVMATGLKHTVRNFVERSFRHVDIQIEWRGNGTDEVGIDRKTGQTLVKINPQYYRPNEVHSLCGDSTKIKNTLGWEPTVLFDELRTK